MPIFQKNDAGEFVEVDEHEFVKGSKLYQDVLEESIERRKKIAEMKAAATVEPPTPVKEAEPVPVTPPPTPLDADALYADFRTRLQREAEEAERAEKQRNDALETLVKEKGLSKEAIPILAKATDPTAVAELLLRNNFRFEDTASGNTGGGQSGSVDMKKVYDRLGLGGK